MRVTMKFIIDGFTDTIVKAKNQLLTQFDDEMKEIKTSLDDAVKVINNFNSFNVDAVVKKVLGFAATGRQDEMCQYLREMYAGKCKDSLCILPVKLYKDSMQLKNEI